MKTYIGTKTVLAEPMDEVDAYNHGFTRSCTIKGEGYHIQYTNPDGSTYDSWSPKSVFEQAYKCADNFLDRLQIEHDEVKERFDKLENLFKNGFEPVADKVGASQAALLLFQRMAMKSYLEVLETRIQMLKDKQ